MPRSRCWRGWRSCWHGSARARTAALAGGLAAALFAAAGLRAGQRLADALPAALEGRDIVLTGVVADLPRQMPDFAPRQRHSVRWQGALR